MASWFLLLEPAAADAASNMARDELIFQLCHERRAGFLRLYSWKQPTFSYGVSQKAARAINLEFIQSRGCRYVRRITGGKTVLHDDEITYALVSSEDVFYRDHDLHQSYLLIARVLVRALQRIGIAARLAQGSSGAISRSDSPCFSFPTPNEIEAGGKKIIGSAQKRDKTALLQHGSIPWRMNYELYAGGARFAAEHLRSSMTTVGDLTAAGRQELCTALVDCFQEFVGQELQATGIEALDDGRLAPLIEKYSSDAWNLSP